VSRGVVHSTVEVHLFGGTISVPVCVAWVECPCGEHLAWVGDAADNANAGLAGVKDEDGWDGDVCGECTAHQRGAR
jgi:hypothetical protein